MALERVETDPHLRLAAHELSGSSYSLVGEFASGVVELPGPVPLTLNLDALV